MTYIEISKAPNLQTEQRVRKAIQWAAYRVMHKRLANNCEILVEFSDQLDGDAGGLATWVDEYVRPRTFSIEISNSVLEPSTHYEWEDELELTIFHEMVHVKQLATEELKDRYPRGVYTKTYKGINVTDVHYDLAPHEDEAYELQEILLKEYKENGHNLQV